MRNRPFARTSSALAATATALVLCLPLGQPAGAEAAPFSDPNAQGYIGFCDKSGHQIRSGDIGSAPFVWTAVSSRPAPSGFGAGRGRGVLNVYQPRKDVDPGEWSGKQLTAASIYTNAAYPIAQATGADPALVDFVSVFPPKWDGLVQLRMYFYAPNRPQHVLPYPATVIRVSGHTWRVVSGGDVPCKAGKGTSLERLSLPSSILNRPTARSTPGATASGSGAGHRSGAAHRSGSKRGATGAVQSSARGSASHAAHGSDKSSGSSAGTLVWFLLAGVVLAGAATAVLRRRRAGPAEVDD